MNQEAAKLTFPSGIPEAVRNAILTYKLPPRRAYHPIKEKKNQSVAVWYGVKLDVVGEGGLVDPNQKYWACLADHKCRKKSGSGSMIKLQGKTTTGATQHLSSVHKIDSAAAQQSKKRCERGLGVFLFASFMWRSCLFHFAVLWLFEERAVEHFFLLGKVYFLAPHLHVLSFIWCTACYGGSCIDWRIPYQYRKADSVDMIDATLNSKAYKDNPSRYNQIQFVKSYVISAACPFNLGENPNVRHQQAVASGGDKDKFAVDSLNKKAVSLVFVSVRLLCVVWWGALVCWCREYLG